MIEDEDTVTMITQAIGCIEKMVLSEQETIQEIIMDTDTIGESSLCLMSKGNKAIKLTVDDIAHTCKEAMKNEANLKNIN